MRGLTDQEHTLLLIGRPPHDGPVLEFPFDDALEAAFHRLCTDGYIVEAFIDEAGDPAYRNSDRGNLALRLNDAIVSAFAGASSAGARS